MKFDDEFITELQKEFYCNLVTTEYHRTLGDSVGRFVGSILGKEERGYYTYSIEIMITTKENAEKFLLYMIRKKEKLLLFDMVIQKRYDMGMGIDIEGIKDPIKIAYLKRTNEVRGKEIFLTFLYNKNTLKVRMSYEYYDYIMKLKEGNSEKDIITILSWNKLLGE